MSRATTSGEIGQPNVQESNLTNGDPVLGIGGQAVIEGVMMRVPGSVATAVRRADGRIVVQKLAFRSLTERFGLLRIPVLRGAVGLIDMMYLGIKTLNWSAEVAMLDEQERAARGNSSTNGRQRPAKPQSSIALLATVAFALLLGIGIFFVTPLFLTTHFFEFDQHALAFNVTAGLIRVGILLAYLAGISLLKDVKRLFQYHGAEHKTVFAREFNEPLHPNVVQRQSRFHPRCGTSFLLIVMFVAIISFSFLDALLISWAGEMTLLLRLATHLPFIPIVGGVAYEFIKFSARHAQSVGGRILIAPGLWLQRITTREPDDSHVEVAIVALRCALGLDDAERYPLSAQPEILAPAESAA